MADGPMVIELELGPLTAVLGTDQNRHSSPEIGDEIDFRVVRRVVDILHPLDLTG